MKNITIFFLLFCCCPIAQIHAQQSRLVLPEIAKQQQSSAFELINLTGDSSVIGYLKINPESNEREAIVTPTDKQSWLQNTVAAVADKAVAEAGSQSVLYLLHDISVGRTDGGNYARVKAAVYSGDGKGYTLASRVDTLLTDKAKDITDIGDLIGTAIAASFTDITSGSVSSSTPLSREQSIRVETERYAFIRREAIPTGIYMSYDAYKAGKPSFEQLYLKREGESASVTVNGFSVNDSTMRPVIP